MAHYLGLDIGSNSIGSAWVDTQQKRVVLGVSVFPAGVDETETKRGAPKNQKRRQIRAQRRSIQRRAKRRRRLRDFLIRESLLPSEPDALHQLFSYNCWPVPDPLPARFMRTPWQLRREALSRALHPYEFGRVLVHMNQRRGAVGVQSDPENPDEGKVKEAIDHLRKSMSDAGSETFGQFMADLMEQRRHSFGHNSHFFDPIRNRKNAFEFHADRDLIYEEFEILWERQKSFGGTLAAILTDNLRKQLDDPSLNQAWRHKGELFGQRRTYWKTSTLGRCSLEPTERCVPIADRHASYFRVVETANNLRIQYGTGEWQPLSPEQRDAVIKLLREPLRDKKGNAKESVSETDIRQTLKIGARDKSIRLNVGGKSQETKEAAGEVEVNTDWFHREIVHGAISLERWEAMDARTQESVNRAILKFDPREREDAEKLRAGAVCWWSLSEEQADKLVDAWKKRPKLEKRLKLSRRAIRNLLPYMLHFDDRWRTQQEARKAYADDTKARDVTTGKAPDDLTRQRYRTGAQGLSAKARYFMRQEKHKIVCENGRTLPTVPPAPTLANPVARKAIHEVRRHLIEHLRTFGVKPDRVVIEFARAAKQSGKVRNDFLNLSQRRSRIRKDIRKEIVQAAFGNQFRSLSSNQLRAAEDRVLLARQQCGKCPYCGNEGNKPALTDLVAAEGRGVEIDHIVPYSRSGDNGLNNKVLCHIGCNRDKGRKTPREWWGEDFEKRCRVAKKLFDDVTPEKTDDFCKKDYTYFCKKDYTRKWKNFTRTIRESDEWRNSQLTDTSYAARQVAEYLADALFDGKGLPERGGERKIFVTHGKYTAMLRRDWQLFETVGGSSANGHQDPRGRKKNRGDHREHAIDAVVIALTSPQIIPELARRAAEAEEIHAEHAHWPGQTKKAEGCHKCKDYRNRHGLWPGEHAPIPPCEPWRDVKEFRRDILTRVYGNLDGQPAESESAPRLIVAHQPVKRRLSGALHEETMFGAADPSKKLFSGRIACYDPPDTWLKPAYLRMPQVETEEQAVTRLTEYYRRRGLKAQEARQRARAEVKSPDFKPAMIDPPPTKTGLVRNLELRRHIRQCLRANDLDPDNYTKDDMKRLVEEGKLRMYTKQEWRNARDSANPEEPHGMPIKRVVLLRTHDKCVILRHRIWDQTQKVRDNPSVPIEEDDPRTWRVYVGGNNHHIEIRTKGDSWQGEVIDMNTAAKRVRQSIQKVPRKNQGVRGARKFTSVAMKNAVDRTDHGGHKFVMSLAQGEMIYMKHPQTGLPDYFVVFKIEKNGRVHFAHHWDARPSNLQKDEEGNSIPHSEREDVGKGIVPSDLKKLAPPGEAAPYKVRISALGKITRLEKD
jgi:CRISPR-associated endonuclease Csn1